MNASKMKVGVKYVVIKESGEGTLNLGDHIHIYDNGDVGCEEAGGWVSKDDGADKALAGVEVEVDGEWLKKLRDELDIAEKAEKND